MSAAPAQKPPRLVLSTEIAAFLICVDFRLIGTEITNGRGVNFLFADAPLFDEALVAYTAGTARCDPRLFLSVLHSLRDLVRTKQGGER